MRQKRIVIAVICLILCGVMTVTAFAAPKTASVTIVDDSSELDIIEELFGLRLAETEACFENGSIRDGITYENGEISEVRAFDQSRSNKAAEMNDSDNLESNYSSHIQEVKELFELSDDYEVVEVDDISDKYLYVTLQKKLENGIYNDLQAVKLFFDKELGMFSFAKKHDCAPNTLVADVDVADAVEIAKEWVSGECEVESCVLEYVDPSMFYASDNTYAEDVAYLAYRIRFSTQDTVIIDATTGDVIGADLMLSEDARCYTIKESANPNDWGYRGDGTNAISIALYNRYRNENIAMAEDAFDRLGYNVTLSRAFDSSDINSSIQEYVRGRNSEYGLYFCGHASATTLGTTEHIILRSTQVEGNWHFVYLDGCSTASTTGWADRFNITDYHTNRAFLGWKTSVYLSDTHAFNEEFWPMIDGTTAVQNAAVVAAGRIPGDGTTPILFFGDDYYNGEAWS